MKKACGFVCVIFALLFSQELIAQNARFTLSTNVLDWANFGTANLELGVGLSQHFSIHASGRYNPWEFTAKKVQIPVRIIR